MRPRDRRQSFAIHRRARSREQARATRYAADLWAARAAYAATERRSRQPLPPPQQRQRRRGCVCLACDRDSRTAANRQVRHGRLRNAGDVRPLGLSHPASGAVRRTAAALPRSEGAHCLQGLREAPLHAAKELPAVASASHSSAQPLARGLPQIDDLLSRDAEDRCDAKIAERQLAPDRRELAWRHADGVGDVANRGDAEEREELRGRPAFVAQVQDQGDALRTIEQADLAPKPAEKLTVFRFAGVGWDGRRDRVVECNRRAVVHWPELCRGGHDGLELPRLAGCREDRLEQTPHIAAAREMPYAFERNRARDRSDRAPFDTSAHPFLADRPLRESRITVKNVAEPVLRGGAFRHSLAQEIVAGVERHRGHI